MPHYPHATAGRHHPPHVVSVGVIAATQALLRGAPAGRIVNVSSGMGSLTLMSNPNFPFRAGFDVVYDASKTVLNAVTVAFALPA